MCLPWAEIANAKPGTIMSMNNNQSPPTHFKVVPLPKTKVQINLASLPVPMSQWTSPSNVFSMSRNSKHWSWCHDKHQQQSIASNSFQSGPFATKQKSKSHLDYIPVSTSHWTSPLDVVSMSINGKTLNLAPWWALTTINHLQPISKCGPFATKQKSNRI